MSCLFEHTVLILNRRRKRKVGSAPSQEGDVADASTMKRLKMPILHHKLSSKNLKASGVEWGDARSNDNRSNHNYTEQVENQEVAQPMQDFLNWEEWRVSDASHRPHCSPSLVNSSTFHEKKKSTLLQNMDHAHEAFHRTKGNDGCSKDDKMTPQHCHQVVIIMEARCVCMHQAPWTQPPYYWSN